MIKKYLKWIIYIIFDIVAADVALTLASLIYRNGILSFSRNTLHIMLIFPAIHIFFIYILRLYAVIWRFAGLRDFVKLFCSCIASTMTLFVVARALYKDSGYNTSLFFITFVFLTLLTVAVRIATRKIMHVASTVENTKSELPISGNIMIIGGGSAGYALINDIMMSNNCNSCDIKCIIDDDISKKGQSVLGVRVTGKCEDIVECAKKYNIDMIVFAIPSCPSNRKSAILNICQKTGCKIRIIPSVYQLLSDENVNVQTLRNVEIEDLLGRDPIKINLDSIMNYVSGKVVMVTGGGGSIGSELCRQIAAHNPKTLIIFDVYENNAYDIQNELKFNYPELDVETLIGSVRDSKRLNCVFEKYHPQIVYHAAAHKHVPLMEDSPNETIKNNVFGTYKTASCADKYGVEKFVLISTDKAVNPTNIMGASKRICEMIVQSFNSRSDTEFVAVRFGNVLGSNGSVIPLFKKQIAEGGPVTVTDPKIIRYFMTIPEAVSLVLQAGASAKGGEIFVLDMGEPVRILDLAENLIRLSGLQPYSDIKIEFTGLRPGEKLYEELLMSEEGLTDTENKLIHIGHPIEFDEDEFLATLAELKNVMYDDEYDIRPLVKKIVPTYKYKSDKPAKPINSVKV